MHPRSSADAGALVAHLDQRVAASAPPVDSPAGGWRASHGASALLAAFALAASASAVPAEPAAIEVPSAASVERMLEQSFVDGATLGLASIRPQDPLQNLCSLPVAARDPAQLARLQAQARREVRFPADGVFVGDWRHGQVLARDGRGGQYNEAPGGARGGNCYACHQLDADEAAYGTLGPSLLGYGRRHAGDADVVRETWMLLWNIHTRSPCAIMPRFGANGVLDTAALRDLMALLLDPASPVNR